jgi:electron transport complex protein RnfC
MIEKTRYIPDGKYELKHMPIVEKYDFDLLYYPITNARCQKGEAKVEIGKKVKVGDVLGERNGGYFTQPFHSTCSGTVLRIEKHLDQFGKSLDYIVVSNDKKYTLSKQCKELTDEEVNSLTKEQVIEIVKNYGLVGLGGSAFPSYVKLQTEDPINVIIANGVECEPHIVSDYLITKEKADRIVKGLLVVMRATSAKSGIIAIKKKYEELYTILTEIVKPYEEYGIKVVNVGNYYPQGWELEVIKNVLGITIPQGKLPAKYGVIDYNTTTLISIYEAVKYNLPVCERIFSFSGSGIKNAVYKVKIGTLLSELVEFNGGLFESEYPETLVIGGPMMGSNITSLDVVVTHTICNLIVEKAEEFPNTPCIRCGSCVLSCPSDLQPVQIMAAYKIKDKDAIKALNVNKCVECGLCSYVCTSKLHLTEFMRLAKKLIR